VHEKHASPLYELLSGQKLNQQSLQSYLDKLSSSAATPGGGAVAAVTGAQAAALISMVCNLTKGKTKESASDSAEALKKEIQAINNRAEQARGQFDQLADDDIEGFNQVMAAYKLPRSNSQERTVQHNALQDALKQAAQAPLATATLASNLAQDIQRLSEIGNKNLVTDVGIAALLVPTTVQAARMNVLINLASMEDEQFKITALTAIEKATSHALPLTKLADSICTSLLK
jgi:formiminotetrahydrofolate cyclodeaminase